MQGVNSLVGNVMFQPAAGSARDTFEGSGAATAGVTAQSHGNEGGTMANLFTGNGTDGTELLVGAIVLGALALLILFRIGGFKAVIAS